MPNNDLGAWTEKRDNGAYWVLLPTLPKSLLLKRSCGIARKKEILEESVWRKVGDGEWETWKPFFLWAY